MPELLLELLSEEIPARLQPRAAADLCAAVHRALGPIMAAPPQGFHGPRRIGAWGEVAAVATTPAREERGPRIGAPDAAIEGFLRKHAATRDALTEAGGFWLLIRPGESVAAADLIARAIPPLLRSFPWPKSMRWGTSPFLWVRPLQRILCVLDGVVVPFALAEAGDAAHGLASGALTEGHRVMAPGAFAVVSAADHAAQLEARYVVRDAEVRATLIRDGIAALAAAEGLEPVPDPGLIGEIAGLVELPVPLLGRIDAAFMDLPPEVMRTTMRVNQRYVALRHADGRPAARFAVVANIAAPDGGSAIVAGNERVLRARLADARFFWDQDRRVPLEARLGALDRVVFHAKLGTQGERVARLERLARGLAPAVGADAGLAARAAQLAKADLATGMVGEFPELQGVMGRYYALADGEDVRVADAIAVHYRPLGPTDAVPDEPVAIAVALADKLDQLAGFFAAGERPTGSGDPFALRRAALGVIRIIRENRLRVQLRQMLEAAGAGAATEEVFGFLIDRLRVQLRAEGARHDIVDAVSVASADDDLTRLLARAAALEAFLATPDGADLLVAHRRAANILRIEEAKDGLPFAPTPDPTRMLLGEERALAEILDRGENPLRTRLAAEDFTGAMATLATWRAPVDAFFTAVMVNDPDPDVRRNRLALLSQLRAAMAAVADLSRLEG